MVSYLRRQQNQSGRPRRAFYPCHPVLHTFLASNLSGNCGFVPPWVLRHLQARPVHHELRPVECNDFEPMRINVWERTSFVRACVRGACVRACGRAGGQADGQAGGQVARQAGVRSRVQTPVCLLVWKKLIFLTTPPAPGAAKRPEEERNCQGTKTQ